VAKTWNNLPENLNLLIMVVEKDHYLDLRRKDRWTIKTSKMKMKSWRCSSLLNKKLALPTQQQEEV
jgi:hypothetical protein